MLWFENNDIELRNIVPFRFCVHPWIIKSGPFIACFALKKLVEENFTGACDLTLQNILINIYMDDFIFSVDRLEDAQKNRR